MSTNRIKISIDHEKCIGSGNCVFNGKGVFEQDEEGLPFVVNPDAQDFETIEFAAASCPVNAITVEH